MDIIHILIIWLIVSHYTSSVKDFIVESHKFNMQEYREIKQQIRNHTHE